MSRRRLRVREIDGIDLYFQPRSYWDVTNPLSAILQNIAGQARREIITMFVKGDSLLPRRAVPESCLVETLDDARIQALSAEHPWFWGGEFLPSRLPGETEIARIVLDSATRDVYSVRACRRDDGRLHYRIVDEYEKLYTLAISSSAQPLTLWQLVRLIDTACGESTPGNLPFVEGILWWQIEDNGPWDTFELAGFARVQSELYSQLDDYYSQRLTWWCVVELAERYGRDPYDDEACY